MEILITSKTHKGQAACVGGLILKNNRFVRLLNPGNWDQKANTAFEIGDVWEIDFQEREDTEPPHIEDIIIQAKTFVRKELNISNYIRNCGCTIFAGNPAEIFNRRLGWTGTGAGFIENKEDLPSNSVGFWISDVDLTLEKDGKHYLYKPGKFYFANRRFPYVGFEPAVSTIPAGTLLRISLARWWKPEGSDMQVRCYLQLSGWYGL